MPHPVIHAEIRSADPDATRAFFGGLFGWTYTDGGWPGYTFVDTGVPDALYTAISPLQGDADLVTFFVGVGDLDASLVQATDLGGRVVQPRVDVPGVAFALIADPQGHIVGLAQQLGCNSSTSARRRPHRPGGAAVPHVFAFRPAGRRAAGRSAGGHRGAGRAAGAGVGGGRGGGGAGGGGGRSSPPGSRRRRRPGGAVEPHVRAAGPSPPTSPGRWAQRRSGLTSTGRRRLRRDAAGLRAPGRGRAGSRPVRALGST